MENGDQIRAVLDEAVKDGKLPMSLALVANSEGVLFTHASGYRDPESGQMMRPDSIFAIAIAKIESGRIICPLSGSR